MARDGICAIATAPGEGGIAIVRMSGAGAREIFSACFRPARVREIVSHRMMYGHAVDARGGALDEVMAVFFASPNTYTREDMFEIQCHGGGVCARRVLSRVIELGARIAEPGEFTRRAFLNGRVDLSRAEAVMALIGAKSEAAARASLRQLEGGISGFVRGVGEEIKEIGIKRENLFVTSKVWNTECGYDKTLKALDKTLSDLGLDYLDLNLSHWPANELQFGKDANQQNVDTWKAMDRLHEEGLICSIGLSNFYIGIGFESETEFCVFLVTNTYINILHKWTHDRDCFL